MKKILFLVSFFFTFSFSAVDVSGFTLDVASVEVIAGVMLGALAIIWVARKVVTFLHERNMTMEDWYDRYEYERDQIKE